MPLYLMPIAGAGTKEDPRGPKYVAQIRAAGVSWQMADFGFEPACLIWVDATPADDATLSALGDVIRIPDALDANLTGGQVTAVTNWLEARNLPAGWLDTSYTVRAALRTVLGAFQFWQRFTALAEATGSFFSGGVSLSTRFNQLSGANQNALIAAAGSFGYDTAALSGASTLRAILKVMADQWVSSFRVGTVTI